MLHPEKTGSLYSIHSKKKLIKTIDLHLIRHKEAMEKVKEALNEEKSKVLFQ